MKTQKIEPARATGDCFAAHRALWEAAAALARRLTTSSHEGHLLYIGASCMRIASEQALQAHGPAQAIYSWRECILAERQMRLATYLGLRRGVVDADTYDYLFRLATSVARVREEERQRLRRELCRSAIV